ncbi:ScbR family autoregulator-binding transcription factor [Streptomyces sp. NPDC090109]|uniref:ScbR family autoregulator-binding transcription factor n=1 Tax=unclassified Streptomyces TaxID=2593676 RepID=UPI000EF78E79|nr:MULTISPECIES: ScbR family autoregulator-binding transcription factor [unclassified Streptomyces]MZE51309.1 TetR family transcriptional regulator [Streptomyces sp. SID5770]
MAKRAVKQERAVRTREALVQAGAEVFGELGFAGASVSKIADRAGLTLGAMYFHFKSKEELAREIVLAQPARVSPPHESEGLQRIVDTTLTWAYGLAHDAVLYAGARLVMEQDRFALPEENSHQQWTDIIASEFRTAQARREVRRTADTEALARLIVSTCTGAQMHSFIESGRADLPQRIEEMWRIVLPSVAVPSAIARLEFGPERGVRD